MILFNTIPSDFSTLDSYSYYIVDPTTQQAIKGLPATQVTAVQGNYTYIVHLNFVGPSPWYFKQVNEIYQVDQNGTIVKTFSFPTPNEGQVHV